MLTRKEYTLKSVKSNVSSNVQLKPDVMTEEKKGVNWAKILKVVAEFITAIVTALFASSFCLPYVVQVL